MYINIDYSSFYSFFSMFVNNILYAHDFISVTLDVDFFRTFFYVHFKVF